MMRSKRGPPSSGPGCRSFKGRGLTMAGEFSGKVAVITGGSRGIGREIAVEFARGGAQTVIVSSSVENLEATSKTIAEAGGPATLAIKADLRNLEGCQEV